MQAHVQSNWVENISHLESSYDVFQFLKQTALEFGFEKFSVVKVPWEECNLATVSIMNNWDPEFVQAYDKLDLAKNSPIFLHVRKSIRPLVFDVGEIQATAPTEQRQKAMDSFKSFRYTKGLIVPVFNASGLRGAISYTGSSVEISQAGVDALQARSLTIFEHLIALLNTTKINVPHLGELEVECLRWSALGKTSAEISTIIELSENSINHHLTTACKKLDAVNRVHAVAKAIRLRLID